MNAQVAQSSRTWRMALLAVVLLTSLVLRLSDLDVYLTVDERAWSDRSELFLGALENGAKSETYFSEHPGVITMWAGAAGIRIAEMVDRLPLGESRPSRIARYLLEPWRAPGTEGVKPLTYWARLLIAITTWLGICLAAWLLWRWQGPDIALIATTLVALDPLYLALSRLHHLDALLTTFAFLSVLSLAAFLFHERRAWLLALSSAMAGLAIANKMPGLLLIPWAFGAIGLAWLARPKDDRKGHLINDIGIALAWLVMTVGALILVSPALHTSPWQSFAALFERAMALGDAPHLTGNFFLGKPVAVPGPAFYPLAWLFRSTPWSLLGLPGLLIKKRERSYGLLAIGIYAVAYTVGMALMDKQFDRYMLPAMPLLDILAAVGWARLIGWLVARRGSRRALLTVPIVASVILVSTLAMLLPTRPYYTSYYNPLFGGSTVAQRTFVIGWGEGLEQVAAYLNEKPNAEKLVVSPQLDVEFGRFFRGRTFQADRIHLAKPDYYVLYASYAQRNRMPYVVEPLWRVEEPEFVATKAGVEYAWLYPNTLHLDFAQEALEAASGVAPLADQGLLINVDAPWARDGQLGVEAVVTAGSEREDVLLSDLARAADGHQAVSAMRVLGLDDAEVWHRVEALLGARGERALDERVAEVEIETYRLDTSDVLPAPDVPTAWSFGQVARLDGYTVAERDGQLALRLHWACLAPTERTYKAFIHLLDAQNNIVAQRDAYPQDGARPTHIWRAGERLLDDHTIPLPEGGLPDGAQLRIGLYDAESAVRLMVADGSGQEIGDHILMPVAITP